MPDRRYTDEEVQRILTDAAESDAARITNVEAEQGMTLAELQRIASEAGLSPAAVVTAAAALERNPSTRGDRRLLGLRAKVAESVSLARPLNDVEWRRLVAVLRDTFEAQGHEEQVEGRREWRNGSLRVAMESVGEGAVLSMRTQKESARALVRGGLAALGMSGVVGTALVVGSANPRALVGVLVMAIGGVAMTAAGALQLPLWLSARRRQFTAIADYARRFTEPGSTS